MKSEEEIIYEATLESIQRIRRVLWLVSSLACIGFFFLYLWYGSWENARITARKAVARELMRRQQPGHYFIDRTSDSTLIMTLLNEAEYIEAEKSKEKFALPLVGLNIPVTDFSVGILMIAAIVLSWLLFYQRRLVSCLKNLEDKGGWSVTIPLLQFHFILIGSHATKSMKFAAKTLFLSLPLLSICFLCSDIIDLFLKVYSNPMRRLALSDINYQAYIYFRLIWQLLLTLWVSYVGYRCKKEYVSTEEFITRFLEPATQNEFSKRPNN